MLPTPLTDQKTILLVDDDAQIVMLVKLLLVDEGYCVITAAGGSEALQKSKEFKGDIALLLSDFQMPGMSGVDLATAVSVDRPNLKVLLMSGFPNGMLILNEGWHFLAKPFIPSQLCSLILGLVFPEKTAKFPKSAKTGKISHIPAQSFA